MKERVFLVHGWSVRETTTYRALHLKLAEHGYALHDVRLGRYVSLDDDLEVPDISRAMHAALVDCLGRGTWRQPFHFITHSTGALVVKHWLCEHYVGRYARARPLRNVVFLAGPHFGSRLAHHGRSMFAQIFQLGETGRKVLQALELGSEFAWAQNDAMFDTSRWAGRGVRLFALAGDRVVKDRFAARIFPGHYETGSDMVVRAASANPNHASWELDASRRQARRVGEVKDIPFAALWRYVHSGPRAGLMNSISSAADPERPRWQNLRLILRCLGVDSAAAYRRVRRELAETTAETRRKRHAFAQLDLRFRDQDGHPIDDYRFELGWLDERGREHASKAVVHKHKNEIRPSHFTVFIDAEQLDLAQRYFMRFRAASPTPLYRYDYGTSGEHYFQHDLRGASLGRVIAPDRTTRLNVVLSRKPSGDLFVFHPGDDPRLPMRWNRRAQITDSGAQ